MYTNGTITVDLYLKERLTEVSCEISAKTEQVERLNKNGQSLAERWVSEINLIRI